MTYGIDRTSFLETRQFSPRKIPGLMEILDKCRCRESIGRVARSFCSERGEP